MSPIDLFRMLTPEYLTDCNLPAPLISLDTPCTTLKSVSYISLPTTSSHILLTASATSKLTRSTTSPSVQPGSLDILLIPCPAPHQVFGSQKLESIRGHAAQGKTDVLSICTGSLLLAESGDLKGRRANGSPALRGRFPETVWDDSRRWVRDGNVWSGGGVTNGQGMGAAYIREKFPGPVAETMLAMADVGEKGI